MAIINVLVSRSNEQRQEIKKKFKLMYGKVSIIRNYYSNARLFLPGTTCTCTYEMLHVGKVTHTCTCTCIRINILYTVACRQNRRRTCTAPLG